MLLESSLSICFTLSGNRPHRAPCADVPGSLRSRSKRHTALSRVMSQQIHRFLYRNRVHVAEQCFDQFQKPSCNARLSAFALEIKPADIVRFPRATFASTSWRCCPAYRGRIWSPFPETCQFIVCTGSAFRYGAHVSARLLGGHNERMLRSFCAYVSG